MHDRVPGRVVRLLPADPLAAAPAGGCMFHISVRSFGITYDCPRLARWQGLGSMPWAITAETFVRVLAHLCIRPVFF